MEPRQLRATELQFCTEVGGEVVTNLAEADPALIAAGSPVRELGCW